MPSPIFFLHNPKGGGSSLRELFSSRFEPGEIAPVFCNAPNEHRAQIGAIRQWRGFKFYAGHYGHDVYEQIGAGHRLITNFRDPVERIVSMYRYWRNNVRLEDVSDLLPGDAEFVKLAHNLAFSNFIRSDNPHLQLYLSNFHFRQLRKSGWEHADPGLSDLIIVKRRISRMPWFYVAETGQLSLSLLRRAFPDLVDAELPRENVSRGDRLSLDAADVDLLVQRNRYDYAIFGHALREQQRRALRAAEID